MPIVRVAGYEPRRGSDRGLAADEDAFTLLATAIERLQIGEAAAGGPLPIHLVGFGPEASADDFSTLLGTETLPTGHGPGAATLVELLERARPGPGPAVIAACDAPPYAGGPSSSAPGAVAFLISARDSERSSLLTIPAPSTPKEGAVDFTRRWCRAVVGKSGGEWVGDWSPTEGAPGTPAVPPAASLSVSEGAYLPKATYRDGRASHWRFVAERCGHCSHINFPIRHRCSRCGKTDRLAPVPLPYDGGIVLASTWIGPGGQPTEFDPLVAASGGYGVALVELAPGVRATLQLSDCAPGELRVGSRVSTLLRRTYSQEGEWRYARKAVPWRGPAEVGGGSR